MRKRGGKRKGSKPVSPRLRDIVGIARLLLKLISSTSNILIAFEELKNFFPKLRIKIVSDDALPDEEARAYPKLWLIKIRRGMYEGLRRGDARARWTLAHELGHIFLQHPRRKIARKRDPASVSPINRVYEYEANTFAAALLAPYDDAKDFKSAEQIRDTFQISLEAAQFRLVEIEFEGFRIRASANAPLAYEKFTVETGHPSDLEDHTAHVCAAILSVIAETASNSEFPVEPLKGNLLSAAMMAATAARLLLDAYESVGRSTGVDEYRIAATLAAAIFYVRPIRLVDASCSAPEEVLMLNQLCAMKAAGLLLGIELNDRDKIILDQLDAHGDFEPTSYLKAHVETGECLIISPSTILTLSNFPRYETYNANNDIRWSDVHQIEKLMNILMLLEKSRS